MTDKKQTLDNLPVNSYIVIHVPFTGGLPKNKGISPDIVQHPGIKYMKGVSCEDHLSFMKNVPIIDPDVPVRAAMGASRKVIAVLKEGYTLLNPGKSDKVTHHKLLYKSSQEQN